MEIVAISTGHSNKDSGAFGIDGTKEFDLNRPLVEMTTRFTDETFKWDIVDKACENLPYPAHLYCTVKAINELKPICAVEVHHNACNSPNVRGGMVIYWDTSVDGQSLAEEINCQISWMGNFGLFKFRQSWISFKKYYSSRTIETLRHLKRRLYYLRKTNCPAVIIEPGYISNVDDLKFVQDMRLELAFGIYKGVQNWVKNEGRG